ncbi:CLI_3235 family bacteriocin precursor [Desulfovibrio inopinatus]
MKKLGKKPQNGNETVKAFSCVCDCWCGLYSRYTNQYSTYRGVKY